MAEDPPPPYSAAVGSQSAPCSVITIPQIPIPAVIQENPPHYSAAVSIREDPQLRINPASLRDDPPLYSKCAAMWENPRGQNNSGALPENPPVRTNSAPVRVNPPRRSIRLLSTPIGRSPAASQSSGNVTANRSTSSYVHINIGADDGWCLFKTILYVTVLLLGVTCLIYLVAG